MRNQKIIFKKILFILGLFLISFQGIQAQNEKTVTGVVIDETNSPLPGVTVLIKGSSKGAITDLDGKFTISVSPNATLVFSFIGMTSQEVTVDTRNEYPVQLVPKVNEFDEVMVVAFAKQKKESVISAISTVKPSELKIPVSNLTNALAGRMSGIISYQQSGEPGRDNAQFFIRGVTTFGYKKDPLILIDNVELTSDDLARLNVDDIAQFSIMKDATATALYGARGANGVILVTTKNGSEGHAKISVRMEHAISEPTQMIKLADASTYMRLNNEAVLTRNPLGVAPFPQSKIDNTEANLNPYVYPSVNWYDELFKDNTTTQRINLNLSGGGSVARYYIAASYAKDNGVLKNDKLNNFNSNIDLRKYTVRSNTNINLTGTTELIVRVNGTFDDYSGPIDGGSTLFNKVMRTSPVLFPKSFPPVGDNERATHVLFGNAGLGYYINPYADMVRGYKEYNRTMISAQVEGKQSLANLIEGLNLRILLNTTRYAYTEVNREYSPFYYRATGYDKLTNTYNLFEINPNSGTEHLNYSEGQKDISTTNYTEMSVDYNKVFDDHGISGMLVMTLQDRKISNAGSLQKSLAYRNQGLSGRFTYSYKSKYFGEFNFGYNGSERFSENERFGFFPSVGAGYIVSNEDFWEPLANAVNKLKFKFTYGLVGNDAIGDENDRFFYLSELNMDDGGKSQYFGSELGYHVNGITVTRYANSKITWERSKKTNAGLEIGLLNGLIDVNADFFHEYRDQILQDRSYVPTTMGLTATPKANIGEASSRGMDISIDYNFISRRNFWTTARGNFTYATSRYETYEEPDWASQGRPWSSLIGRSLSQQAGYIAERLFIDENDIANSPVQSFGFYQAGDIKYKDINNDGKITDADRVYFGYPTTPEITFGFGFSAGYKNLDLSMFFQGNARVAFFLEPKKISPFIDALSGDDKYWMGLPTDKILVTALMDKIAQDHWSEDNRNSYAFWPRLSNQQIDNNYQNSTWWMRDGSFMRLKTVELGYSLPKKAIQKLGIESCRFYLTGNNLFTISKFKLWDTEMGGNGLGYPIQRVYNVGLNISF
jgi:TonB-linked SusC/RagA family outer membrane protein